jgi:hypothetical protein
VDPLRDEYSDEDFTEHVEGQLRRNINVIADTRLMNQEHIEKLRTLVAKKGWGGSVIFYP